MRLIIDAGNTRVKVAVFEQYTMIDMFFFETKKVVSKIKKINKNFDISSAIISNVALISEEKIKKIENLVHLIRVSSTTKVPFSNLYKTPKTLGVDRIALVTGAVKKYPSKNVLIIDAGTCITYDFVNKDAEYLGGAISLGMQMRFKALHKFTAKLPLVEKSEEIYLIGNSTEKCINSGVTLGIIKEIEGIILAYQEKFLDLTVVLTGGDTNFLSKQLKSSIFANQNFLLEGLNELLIFNETNE